MTLNQNTPPTPDIPRIETTEAAQALCKRILETTTDLIDLLDRETAMLKKGKPGELESVHVRKAALNALITRDMSVFRRDAEFITMAAPDEISAIKDQHAQFQKSLDANKDALVAMKAVSESLLHTIANRAKAKSAGPEVYGQDADVSVGDASGRSAISVNTVL